MVQPKKIKTISLSVLLVTMATNAISYFIIIWLLDQLFYFLSEGKKFGPLIRYIKQLFTTKYGEKHFCLPKKIIPSIFSDTILHLVNCCVDVREGIMIS